MSIKFLDNLSEAYYLGKPLVSDAEFDSLAEFYNYNSVGCKVGEVPHYKQMYSLQKVFDASNPPIKGPTVPSPKLDGGAVSLLYVNGCFVQGLTRGNGKKGQDITANLQHIVPARIGITDTIQVTGEVVAPKSIPNARNYASGALQLKDQQEFLKRDLYFIAYDYQDHDFSTWSQALKHLATHSFKTVLTYDCSKFRQDGIVFRVDDIRKYKSMGFTSKHPRGAYALKEQRVGEVTTLIDVIWQVGKSGVVSPVAILDPVFIEGAKVQKATLHNIEYIKALNLMIGCKVEVIRSGEIIPRIVRRVD